MKFYCLFSYITLAVICQKKLKPWESDGLKFWPMKIGWTFLSFFLRAPPMFQPYHQNWKSNNPYSHTISKSWKMKDCWPPAGKARLLSTRSPKLLKVVNQKKYWIWNAAASIWLKDETPNISVTHKNLFSNTFLTFLKPLSHFSFIEYPKLTIWIMGKNAYKIQK